jgi:O-methyltransferase involved in polyketide biosynthesis
MTATMTAGDQAAGPEGTAERVAPWRAMHVQVDPPPHVLEDEIGLRLAAPHDGWRRRPDMDPDATSGFRAAIVARARFIEDLVTAAASRGVTQYVVLGAGLDTFAQRRPEIAARLRVFEVDQPGPQAWKRQRLIELGYGIPGWLRLAPGSTLAMTFLLPAPLLDDADRSGLQASEQGARASGTPFISFYTPAEMLELAREAGFSSVRHVPGTSLGQRYFSERTDGLRPCSGEDLLVASTGGADGTHY